MKDNNKTKAQLITELQELRKRVADSGKTTVPVETTSPLQSPEQARMTAHRLSTLIANLPGGIIIETPQRKVLQVNQKFCELFGIDAPPVTLRGADCRQAARQVKALFIDEDGFIKHIDEILEAGKAVQNEELLLKDGRVFERDYVPVEVAPGQVEHLWHYRDITERKKVEQALKETNKILQDEHNIFTAGPVVVFKWRNASGWPVEYASPNVKEVFGYTADEFMQGAVSYAEIIPEEDIGRVAEEVRSNSESGAISFKHQPYRIIRKDGQPVWLLDYTIILRNDAGEITHYLGYVVDISEQKRAEQNLQASKKDLQILVDSVNVIPWRFDLKNNRFTFIGRQVERILGYPVASWSDLDFWAQRIHPDDRQSAVKYCLTCTEKGEDHDFEYRGLTPDGKTVWIRDIVTVRCDERGAPAELIGYMIDISEQKRHENQIEVNLREMRLLQQTIEKLNRAQSLKEVCSIAVKGIIKILQADRSAILLFEDDDRAHFTAWKNLSAKYRRAVDGHSPWQRHDLDAEPIRIADISKADIDPEIKKAVVAEGIAALSFVPLAGADRLLGKFMVYFNAPHECNGQQLQLTQVIAQNLAAVIARQQALEQTRRAEQKYRSIFENALEGIYQSTPQGRFITVNPAMVKMFGFNNEAEMLALKNTASLYWNEKERKRLVKLANGAGFLSNAEVKMKRADGSPLWVLMNDRAVKDSKGKTLYYEGTVLDISERLSAEQAGKKAEQKLRSSEERYRMLFNLLPYGGEVINTKGIITDCSPSTTKMLGYSKDELTGQPITKFLDTASKQIFKEKFHRLLKGEPQQAEIKMLRRDGKSLDILRAASPILDEKGNVAAVLGLSVDISERVMAQKELQRSETLFRAITEQSGEGISLAGTDGNYVKVNLAFCKMTGYSEAELLAMNVHDLIPPETEVKLFPKVRDGKSGRREIDLVRKDGSRFMAEITGYPLLLPDQQLVLGIVRDVTAQKQAEQALRESEERLQTLINVSPDYIYFKDDAGRWLVVNKRGLEIFGLQNIDYYGMRDSELAQYAPFFKEALEYCENSDKTAWLHKGISRAEEVIPQPDAEDRICDVIKVPVFERDGARKGLVVIGRDITERKQAEEQLLWSKQQQDTINALLQIPLTNVSLEEKLNAALKVIVTAPLLVLQEKGAIFLTDRDGQNLILQAEHNMPDALLNMCAVTPFGHCLCGIAAKTKEIQFAGCVDERHANLYKGIAPHGHYNVPILSGDTLLGVVVLYLPENYREKKNDRVFLKAIAHTLASIFEHSKAKDALEQQLTYSQALNSLSEQIILEQEEQKLLEAMARLAGETLGLDRCLIYYVDLQKREARALCEWLNPQAGEIIPTADVYPLDLLKESEKQVTASRRWLESHSDAVNPLFIAEGSDKLLHGQMQIKSLLWYPFAFDEGGYYLLVFNQVHEYHHWHETEMAFTEALTHQAAMAVMKINLMSEMGKANAELSRLATVVEQASESIVVTDTEGRIEYVNPAYEKLTGYRADEAIGQNPRIVKSGRQPESFYKELWDTILRGETWAGKIINKGKEGSEYTEEAVIFPMKNTNGEIVNFCKIARDVSHEQELEEQLRRSQKLETIGTLAGGIAHDFNNILTPILGYADMALFNLKETEPLHHDIQQVLKAAHRAKDLVEQILLFAKQSEKERQPLALQTLVKEALKLLHPSIPTTVDIRQRIDADCEKVLADASQIHQVIVNLCTNAWQAMEDKGGTLTIELQQVSLDAAAARLYPNLTEGEYACLTIADSGCGMDKATLERIFEPFFTTKAVDKGTGLGLSVVHGIVRSHKGDILAESAPGKGSAFHVYLPVFKAEAKKAEAETKEITGGQESILVVDDDEVVAELVKKMLENLGYKVESFNSGIDALKEFRRQPDKFDLLISDLTMPEMTGLDLAEQARKARPDLPVMLMTGYGDNLNEDTRRTYGVKQVVAKPIVLRDLAAAIRKILNK